MECKNCGTTIEPDNLTCPNCGSKTEAIEVSKTIKDNNWVIPLAIGFLIITFLLGDILPNIFIILNSIVILITIAMFIISRTKNTGIAVGIMIATMALSGRNLYLNEINKAYAKEAAVRIGEIVDFEIPNRMPGFYYIEIRDNRMIKSSRNNFSYNEFVYKLEDAEIGFYSEFIDNDVRFTEGDLNIISEDYPNLLLNNLDVSYIYSRGEFTNENIQMLTIVISYNASDGIIQVLEIVEWKV